MPTRTGWSLLAAAVALYLLGWRLGYPELVTLAVAAALVLAVAFLWSLRRPDVSARRQIHPARVSRGDVAVCRVSLRNRGRRATGVLRADDQVGGVHAALDVPSIPPGAVRDVSYRLPTGTRGVFQIGPLTTTRTDPLGLVARRQRWTEPLPFWVHPRVHQVRPASSGRRLSLDAPLRDRAPNGTITFHALREYVHGDDLRHIHWRTSARTGTLMVRQNVDTSQPRTTIVLDTRSGAYAVGDHFEAAVELAASVVMAGVRAGHPMELRTTDGGAVHSDRTHADGQRFLDRLAEVQPAAGGDLGTVANALAAGRGGSSLLVVTGRLDGSDVELVARIARRFDSAAVALAASSAPTGLGTLRVVGGDTGPALASAWNALVGR